MAIPMDGLIDPATSGAAFWSGPAARKGMPPESPAEMPIQSLKEFSAAVRRPLRREPTYILRRIAIFGGALAVTSAATWGMEQALAVGGITPLEGTVLVLFALNLLWISLTFTSSIAGAVAIFMRSPSGRPQRLAGRTAILMPIYNEDPARVFSAIEAMAAGVADITRNVEVDWVLLSDTTRPDVAMAEEAALVALRERLGQRATVYYRRRRRNIGRKAANIADFCRRWGGAYEYLLVLDSDSLMEPATIVELISRMAADPDAGLIQTVPRLVRARTLMARLQQFANRVYGPVISAGLAWWTGGEGNYWGHNAIIRRAAFMSAAGLPVLPGRLPLGGPILSHDFVEAALIRRAGWKVVIADDLAGSYEESPPSLIDFAVRDRRWCQGNMQHIGIVTARGLNWVSRFHLVTGIFSYLSSIAWVLLIAGGLAMAVQAKFTPTDYFQHPFDVFPTWPELDSALEIRLLVFTAVVLLAPKFIGAAVLLSNREERRLSGGVHGVLLGIVVETLLSTLLAPITMVMQSVAIVSIFMGHDGGWKPQRRDDGRVPLHELWHQHRLHVAAGVGLAWAAAYASFEVLLFLSPVILGLVLAVVVSAASGSPRLGHAMARAGLLRTPEEARPPAIERRALRARAAYRMLAAVAQDMRAMVRNEWRRRHHLAIVDTGGARKPGDIDPVEAVVAAKVREANSLDEALAYLLPEEQAVALGTPALFERLSLLGDTAA